MKLKMQVGETRIPRALLLLIMLLSVAAQSCSSISALRGTQLKALNRQDVPAIGFLKSQNCQLAPVLNQDKTLSASCNHGYGDTTVILKRTTTGKELMTLRGGCSNERRCSVRSIAFTQDGTKILVGYWGAIARLWDISSGRVIQEFFDFFVDSVVISPNDKLVAIGMAGMATSEWWDREDLYATVNIYAVDTGEWLIHIPGLCHDGGVRELRISEDNKFLMATVCSGAVKSWEIVPPAPK